MLKSLALVLGLLAGSAFGADKPAPLVVVTGGYASCSGDGAGGVSPFGGNTTAAGVRFVNGLHDHFTATGWKGMSDSGIRWLFSCFTETSDLFLQGSEDDGVVQTGAWDFGALLSRVEKLSDDYQRPIFVIGHSHGGWLAMQLVEAFRKPITAGYLVTNDPISFVECNASTYADAIFSVFGAWERTAPCRRAPGDFTGADIRKIRENLNGNQWKHYWQQHFVALHSGEIPGGPDTSMDMSPFFSLMSGGVASSWSAHTRIAGLDSIWYGLGESFKRVFEEGQ